MTESVEREPDDICAACGGPLYQLADGYDACRGCGVEFNAGRRLAEVLDDIERIVNEFVVLPTEHESAAIPLWTVQTHFIAAFDVVMFMHVFSPEPESGKTRLLEVLSKLVRAPWLVSRPTAATLFRMIEERQPTLLWDEIDRVFSVRQIDASMADLQAVVNSGHKRGAVVPRCIGEGKSLKVKDFPVFTSMAFAGINQLRLPDTVRSRSIPIALRRRAPDEEVRRWREREADEMVKPILTKLESLVIPLSGPLRDARPSIPDDLGDRAADGWEGLLAIADLAGGDWPKRARAAARDLNGLGRGLGATTTGLLLLADIETVFITKKTDRISSADLVASLQEIEESDWSWMTKNILAKKLRGFGIRPQKIRLTEEKTLQGYRLEDFADPFRRYLQKAGTNGTNGTPQVAPTSDVPDVPVAPPPREEEKVDDPFAELKVTLGAVESQTLDYIGERRRDGADFTTITTELNRSGFAPPPWRGRWELQDTVEVHGWRQ